MWISTSSSLYANAHTSPGRAESCLRCGPVALLGLSSLARHTVSTARGGAGPREARGVARHTRSPAARSSQLEIIHMYVETLDRYFGNVRPPPPQRLSCTSPGIAESRVVPVSLSTLCATESNCRDL